MKQNEIGEILDEAQYMRWDDYEQLALAEMLSNHGQGKPFARGTFQTGRVTKTFIKIISTRDE